MTDFDVSGDLTVLQGALLRKNVFVASDASLGPTAVQGDLVVAGTTTFQNTLQIDGPVTATRVDADSHAVLESLLVTETLSGQAATFTGKATIAGLLNAEGGLTSTGNVTLAGPVSVSGGPLTLAGDGNAACVALVDAAVAEDATVNRATVTGNMALTGGIASNGVFTAQLADIDGELSAPSATLSAALQLNVTGQLSVGTMLSVSGALDIVDELRCSEALLVGNHLTAALGSADPPSVTSFTIFDNNAIVDPDATAAVQAGSTDNVGTISITNVGAGTRTAWRLSTITVTFGTPFSAPPFVVLSVDQNGVTSGQGWGAPGSPPVLWVTDVTTTSFTIFFAEFGLTYVASLPGFIRYFVVGAVA